MKLTVTTTVKGSSKIMEDLRSGLISGVVRRTSEEQMRAAPTIEGSCWNQFSEAPTYGERPDSIGQ